VDDQGGDAAYRIGDTGVEVVLAGVTVTFDSRAEPVLDRIDLRVAPGEAVALLGSSGAGKSTLLRVLLGAVRPVAGQVRVGGLDPFGTPTEVRRLRQAAGFVRQRDDLVPGLTARTNLLIGQAARWRLPDWAAVLRGAVPARYAARVETLVDRHGIAHLLGRRVEHLSGGQRQRVALVRALLGQPRLLLADETTSGLDPVRAEAAIADLRNAGEATLLVATHDVALAGRFPRVVALRDGRIVHDGPPPDAATMELIYAT
jgi:ABC-type phosphate/phosphonate transport system ATPase subunit